MDSWGVKGEIPLNFQQLRWKYVTVFFRLDEQMRSSCFLSTCSHAQRYFSGIEKSLWIFVYLRVGWLIYKIDVSNPYSQHFRAS